MTSKNGYLYQTSQIRLLEQLAFTTSGITGPELMQRAGLAAFNCLRTHWPRSRKIAIFCGSGNNGGDGFVLAQLAFAHGYAVTVLLVGTSDQIKTEEAKNNYRACVKSGFPVIPFHSELTIEADVLIDAICGIGLTNALRTEVAEAVYYMQSCGLPILSLDVPTGIQADTGEVMGVAVKANVTITFIAMKLGLLMSSGLAHTGQLICDDLELPANLINEAKPIAERLNAAVYRSYLKPRERNWHKGLSGHVLIVGGGPGFSGASRLAAESALRIGAGLVTIATHPDHAALLNVTRPEIMCHGIHNANELYPLLSKADVIILGPGLTQTDWALALFELVMTQSQPMVVDADGLNILAIHPIKRASWVLTPHPGEAARLLGITTQDIEADRFASARAIQQKYQGTCVLKGAGTIVMSDHVIPSVCDQGNSGMATAGMGDVLSGVIGGLLAQKVPVEQAARLGVVWHAMAGDKAAKKGQRGLIATDLFPYFRQLCNED